MSTALPAQRPAVPPPGLRFADPLPDDRALMREIAAGAGWAVGLLYERHVGALMALARRMMGDPGEAEDLVHDVFVEVWARAHTYDPARSSVRAWLIVRTRSRALDRLRSARHTRVSSLPSEEPPRPGLDGLARAADQARAAEHSQLRDRLSSLTEEQRVALEMAYFSGLSAVAIADQLAVPVGTVKSRLAAALKRLREGAP